MIDGLLRGRFFGLLLFNRRTPAAAGLMRGGRDSWWPVCHFADIIFIPSSLFTNSGSTRTLREGRSAAIHGDLCFDLMDTLFFVAW
jgi:hypothetical protein